MTPAIKVLNDDAKLWISDENFEMCRWREDRKTLIPHTLKEDVRGNIILNPRMLILQSSLLLKVETKTGRILRAWIARESKEENTYMCVRKYMILFVDEDNNPLHEDPLQLTARGCFQFEFDKQLCEFKTEMTKAYNEKAIFMKNSWYSMCVFVPTFKSMMRGEGNKQKKACITTGHEIRTKENWLSLCVGRRNDPANKFWTVDDYYDEGHTYAQYVYKLYNKTRESCKAKGWWKREE
jgi:hypothetical protein